MTRDEAIRASIGDTYEVFGNYSTYNRPLWMADWAGPYSWFVVDFSLW
jgi:hypothetical protein